MSKNIKNERTKMLELLANMIYIEHILTKEGISMNNIKELYGEAIIDSRDSEELNIGERIKLEYYKTISKLFANGNRETYGKKYKDTKKEKIESREINNILLEEKQTEKLLKILINNKVTPIALDDVLTDLIRA